MQRRIKPSECGHKNVGFITRVGMYGGNSYHGICEYCDAEVGLDFSEGKKPTRWTTENTHFNSLLENNPTMFLPKKTEKQQT